MGLLRSFSRWPLVGFRLGCWVVMSEELALLVFGELMVLVNILIGVFIRSAGLIQLMAK